MHEPPSRTRSRSRGRGGIAAALIAGVLAVGCRTPSSRRFGRGPVVLISIDTLRADHLPAYGYSGVRTPNLDAFRKDSVLYTDAVSHVPLTLPSHATLLTGLLPPATAVRDNEGYVLPADRPTLAATLGGAGYATGAAVSAVVLSSATGISRGFGFYDDAIDARQGARSLGQVQRPGAETEKIAETWITAHRGAPFLFFLHLYEPHTPYEPAAPFDVEYRDHPYDGEIASADRIVGSLLSFLRGAGLYDGALIVLLSDHGEGLGDHGEAEHGILLYRETLHVPLLVKFPGANWRGSTVSRPVGLVDVFPTIARVTGVTAPAGLSGRALPPASADSATFPVRRIYSETLYPRYHFGWSDLAALTDDRFEYIHAPKDELYDIVADPAEKRNLAPGLPAAFREMRNALLKMDLPRQAPGTSDPEQARKLASLGYLGSSSASESAAALPNPMEHVSEVAAMQEASRLRGQGRPDAAAATLEALLRRAPNLSDAWIDLGNLYREQGFPARALGAYREADRRSPGNGRTLASIANAYLDLGDAGNAAIWAERSIAANGPAEAHEVRAEVLLRQRRFDEADREARLAAGGAVGRIAGQVLLARIQAARGDLAGALETLAAAERSSAGSPEGSDIHFVKGDVLARMGRNAEAEQELRTSIRDHPQRTAAWSSLAILMTVEGRPDQTRATLESLVRTVPGPRGMRAASECYAVLGDQRAASFWKAKADAADAVPASGR
ncbi:MAG TPA: sulfatase-like hydrolase/transferase [Thermoanaerobaculia bacterium]|nr:sulfatase-like hydrolase/transferase [Thermoanaerobaculia bacterium]